MSEMDVAYALKSHELAIDARDKAIKELQAQLFTMREQLLEMKAANRELRSLNVKPGISLGYVSELREIVEELAAALEWAHRRLPAGKFPVIESALAKVKATGILLLAKNDRS